MAFVTLLRLVYRKKSVGEELEGIRGVHPYHWNLCVDASTPHQKLYLQVLEFKYL